jgi:single-stranded DNA-binding protein
MSKEVTLVGTVFNLEISYSQNGVAIGKFNLSEYDGKDKRTDTAKYMSTKVVCFKELAEEAGNTLQDKDNVIVVGRRSQETWDDKETGKKRYKNIVIADEVAKNIRQFGKGQASGAEQFGQGFSAKDFE